MLEDEGFDPPTATAIPPGISVLQGFPSVAILSVVVTANRMLLPMAHSLAMGGRPFPVTSRAVNIQT
jgi:hypothetical protein